MEKYTAHVYADGTKAWYQDGKRHRTDGPAVEYADGTKEWWKDDKRIESLPDECDDKIVEIEGKRYKLTSI